MSKESRRRQRTAGQVPGDPATPNAPAGRTGPRPTGTTSRPPSTSSRGTERTGRRERTRIGPKPSLFQRYRTVIVGAGVVAVVALVGAGLLSAATQPVYACSRIWEPSPTATPAEGASPQPGYVQPDMGNGHITGGSKLTYTYCPPASGDHLNVTALGPIKPRLYGPDDKVNPNAWVHNLEHGALVLLYRGDSPAATPEGQAALASFYADYPPSPVCGFQPGTTVGPVFARFDEMAWPMAAMVWGRVLPLQELDTAAVLEFDQTFGERTNILVEDLCADKRVSPSPSGAPSASPSASASTAPGASPSAPAAPSAGPSGSAAPSASPSAS